MSLQTVKKQMVKALISQAKNGDLPKYLVEELETDYPFTVSKLTEDDGSTRLSINEVDIDVTVNGETLEEAAKILDEDLKEYVQEYCDNLDEYLDSQRDSEYLYILRVLDAVVRNKEIKFVLKK